MLKVQGLPSRSARTRRTRFGAAGLVAVAAMLGGALFLAGCSASSSASSGTAAREALPSGQAMAEAPAVPSAVPSAAAGLGLSAAPQGSKAVTTVQLAPGSDIIYTAELTVRAQNVNSATTRATQIAQ